MIIGIDATPLTVETGGIRRYTEELARALAREPGDQLHLLSDQPFSFPSGANLHVHPANGGRWWSVGLPAALRRHHIEVFHGTDFAVPYLNSRPSVMTLHDLSPWREGDSRIRSRTPMLLRLGIATMVITPSDAVRREAIDYFGLHPPRVAVVPEAASELFHPRDPRPEEPSYILYAGTIEPRKNLDVVVEAWRVVRSQHPVRLVFAGRRRGVEEAPGVEYAGAVSDEELARLYSEASAVVYPTLYEGFGLPVLEAMQSGVPVIASRDPAVMETAGGAALHAEANDVRGWASAMAAVVADATLAASLRERGLKRASEFSWAYTAQRTREVYQEAIRRFHG
jgi:glycosyltransferase involved in cell wall biosynthesis